MRQLYDHFFEILSPDKEVKKSEYFKKKKGEKPNQIHRIERIKYAANIKIIDREHGKLLEANATHQLDLYDKLNKLHKRGPLNRKNVRISLEAMKTVLEEWIDAINL